MLTTYANEALSRRFSIFLSGVVAVTTRLLLVPTVEALASKTNLEYTAWEVLSCKQGLVQSN